MPSLYGTNGFVDMRSLISLNYPITIIIGARGTGKTYGALKTYIEDKKPFILMRRTQSELEEIIRPEFNPFKSLNNDMGWNIIPSKVGKSTAAFYEGVEIDGKIKPSGERLGYAMALSTMASVRGFDASDITHLFYDEFIPEKHVRMIKSEGEAVFNAYETINRNRELKGQPPLYALFASNSNNIASPVLMELELSQKFYDMERKGQEYSILKDRGILLINLAKSPISARKSKTVLYKAVKDGHFKDMSLSNKFSVDASNIKPRPLIEYNIYLAVGELCIYKHKANNTYYVTKHRSGQTDKTYTAGETDLKRFIKHNSRLWFAYMKNKVMFETVADEVLFNAYFGNA